VTNEIGGVTGGKGCDLFKKKVPFERRPDRDNALRKKKGKYYASQELGKLWVPSGVVIHSGCPGKGARKKENETVGMATKESKRGGAGVKGEGKGYLPGPQAKGS